MENCCQVCEYCRFYKEFIFYSFDENRCFFRLCEYVDIPIGVELLTKKEIEKVEFCRNVGKRSFNNGEFVVIRNKIYTEKHSELVKMMSNSFDWDANSKFKFCPFYTENFIFSLENKKNKKNSKIFRKPI